MLFNTYLLKIILTAHLFKVAIDLNIVFSQFKIFLGQHFYRPIALKQQMVHIQGAANKSNPLPCFVNISTMNRNF